ncbi:CDC27 protein [Fusarium falciforme]|uniref:DNA polymerase delta subunit 3 n=1 Tax=Fusarium falciforme TaxID=195108 RepID=A0A9W8QSE3_9HYPO|nr:DNA polymerase delta subunit 3 [Fusarium falciforme]KAJ4174540.1 CDC27 protein [Fusarium falciforme]KAJ4176928.1 CDC27 protein [Fusarium falciforme]KAJ4208650.1 CDC27 protein [Fusarium falciforme]KAJ4243900.1 CDC27 protein [Fusarium falciforme]WAO90534.1 DNA polymerase delta subunit 3 [Fusarium falciforme]
MDEHRKFLADRLLSEERPITYRVLSRALDVHVNTAKEMLYDFHKYQNASRANSVYATYLVYGIRSSDNQESDGDVEMASSAPENETFSETVPVTTMTLAREEELSDILADYQQVTSIHVYSLAPHPQRDLSLLSDVSAQLSEYPKEEDASAASKKYGIISNPQARKRDRKGRPQAPPPATSQAMKREPASSKSAPAAKVKEEPSTAKSEAAEAKPTKKEASAPSSKEGTPVPSGSKKPAAKKGMAGSIMQSFAKAAARPPKPKPTPKEEDTSMALSDDGEADDSDIVASKSKPAVDAEEIRRKRQEREDALRKMMEDDDEDDNKEDSDKEEEQEDEEMEEAPEPEPEPEEPKDKKPSEVISSSGDGRRRGKRRVMKKKRILDDQGYMVTIQEEGWESFSEEEAPKPAKKPAPTPTPSSSGSKAKKPAPKGQGNIMSFFSKK